MGQGVLRVVQPAEEFALEPAGSRDGGSRHWFDSLFHAHYGRVTSMLGRLVGDRGQAEEIAADAFTKLSQQAAGLEDRDGMTAWVYRVAINAGLDVLRATARRKRREEMAHAEQLHRSQAPGALDELLRQERRERVREVLSLLKPRDAQMLLLRANGLAYRELAETLGIPASSVGTMLARAEAEFEKRFRSRHGDDV